jgi:hypothetical protein
MPAVLFHLVWFLLCTQGVWNCTQPPSTVAAMLAPWYDLSQTAFARACVAAFGNETGHDPFGNTYGSCSATFDCSSGSPTSCSYQPPYNGSSLPPLVPFPPDQCKDKWLPTIVDPVYISALLINYAIEAAISPDRATDFFCKANQRSLSLCRDGSWTSSNTVNKFATLCQSVKAPLAQW